MDITSIKAVAQHELSDRLFTGTMEWNLPTYYSWRFWLIVCCSSLYCCFHSLIPIRHAKLWNNSRSVDVNFVCFVPIHYMHAEIEYHLDVHLCKKPIMYACQNDRSIILWPDGSTLWATEFEKRCCGLPTIKSMNLGITLLHPSCPLSINCHQAEKKMSGSLCLSLRW